MKNLFKFLTLIVLIASGFFIFKSFNYRAKIQETQSLTDLKHEIAITNRPQKLDTENSLNTNYQDKKSIKDPISILADDDLYLGDKNSKVVMIEFDSLTCPHCKMFHDTIFPEIKARYIDTGKILYINRPFPTDGISFKFAEMVSCVKDNKTKILLRDLIFGSQETLFKKLTRDDLKARFDIKDKTKEDERYIEREIYKILDNEIEDFGLVSNIDQKLLKTCIRDTDPNGPLAKSILNKSNAAYSGKYKINATPSFIINGKKYDGAQNVNYWIKILDAEIAANSSKTESKEMKKLNSNTNINENQIINSTGAETKIPVEKFIESDINTDITQDTLTTSQNSLPELYNKEAYDNSLLETKDQLNPTISTTQ